MENKFLFFGKIARQSRERRVWAPSQEEWDPLESCGLFLCESWVSSLLPPVLLSSPFPSHLYCCKKLLNIVTKEFHLSDTP